MIVGLGIDVCDIARVRRSLERSGARFCARILTEGELAYCDASPEKAASVAARFAAKEACIKAFGGVPGGRWHDIEVTRRDGDGPCLQLHGAAGRLAAERKVANTHLSITHDANVAAAVVVLETSTDPASHFVDSRLREVEAASEEPGNNALVAALAGAVAHELNQPLTSILSYAALMTRRLNHDSEHRQTLEVIRAESERMARIIDSIHRIRRFETKEYVGGQRIIDLERSVDPPDDEPAAEAPWARAIPERLVQLEKLAGLGRIVAGVIHELNNPLTTLTLYGERLLHKARGQQRDPREIEQIRRMIDAAERMTRIVKEVGSYARPASSATALLSVARLLDTAIELCEPAIAEAMVRVERDYTQSQVAITGNENQLHQVLINLIVNSCHAIRSRRLQEGEGCIRVTSRVQCNEERVVLSVMDNGAGFGTVDPRRAFEPFFTTKSREEGTGLGLAIVQRIVEQHHGVVRAHTNEFGGATLEVDLPLCKDPSNPEKTAD